MIKYRSGYKYQLAEDCVVSLILKDVPQGSNHGSRPFAGYHVVHPYFLLEENELTIKKGYAWDGPSGPTFDSKNFMRGSLVHDCLYQLMRENRISKGLRMTADLFLRQHCREDGMSAIRAWWVFRGIRMFGGAAVEGSNKREIMEAP